MNTATAAALIDVRQIAPRKRHPLTFSTFRKLPNGQSMEQVNDRDGGIPGTLHHLYLSVLPAGIYQAGASVTTGPWFARSPAIIHSKVMESLAWLRVPGDIVFALGALLLAVHALRLLRRPAGERAPRLPHVAKAARP